MSEVMCSKCKAMFTPTATLYIEGGAKCDDCCKPTSLELAMEAAKKRREKQAADRVQSNQQVTRAYGLKK